MRQPSAPASPATVEALFTRPEGYVFARWGRPIVPVIFGVEEATLAVFKGAIEAVVALAGHQIADHDHELGANLMMFFCRDWSELVQVPNLDRLVEGLASLVTRLEAQGANQYRMFRFDEHGAIRAVFVFIRVDAALAEMSAEVLALDQAVRLICLWGDDALAQGVLVRTEQSDAVLGPQIGAVIRAAYDPVMPAASRDPAHALRLFARMSGE